MRWCNLQSAVRCLATLAALLAIAISSSAAEAPQGIIVIGWDGARRAAVKQLLAGDDLPNLAALAKDGAMVDIDIVTGATETGPGFAQLLSGYVPDDVGVRSDKVYQSIPRGYTVFERLKIFFGRDNIQTVAIIAKTSYYLSADRPFRIPHDVWRDIQIEKKKLDDNRPGPDELQGGVIVKENGEKFVEMQGGPYLNAKDDIDVFINGLMTNDKVAAAAVSQLQKCKDRRFFIFLQFIQPDKNGHKYGENSLEYLDGIKADDFTTGAIIDRLKVLNIYDKTLVYVTADHGFDVGKKTHYYAPYIFLATNDKQVGRDGAREDIAPTVLKRFGLDLSQIDPPLAGIPLDQPAPERKAPEKPAKSTETQTTEESPSGAVEAGAAK
jgi:predicted AlkP superfamily pyrophosphatase or phosphodiesterase